MARRYRRGTPEYGAHGEGLGKAYTLSGRDIRAKRARGPYDTPADPNRLMVQRELDALDRARDREKADELAQLLRRAHLKLRALTRQDGKPPRDFILKYRGEILSSHDPEPLPRKVVARALARKMKAARRKR